MKTRITYEVVVIVIDDNNSLMDAADAVQIDAKSTESNVRIQWTQKQIKSEEI